TDLGELPHRRFYRRGVDVHAAGDDHIVRAPEHHQPPVSVRRDAAEIVRAKPPRAAEGDEIRRSVVEIPPGERVATEPDPTVVANLHLDAGQGSAVVYAAAGGFGGSIGGVNGEPGAARFSQEGRVDRGTAEKDSVERGEGLEVSGGAAENTDELGRHERGVAARGRIHPGNRLCEGSVAADDGLEPG